MQACWRGFGDELQIRSLDGNNLRISVSIGISTYTSSSVSADSLLDQADMALYRSKDQGRNQYNFHSEEINQEVLDRFTIANELKLAIERNELEHYLPEVGLSSGRILGILAIKPTKKSFQSILSRKAPIRSSKGLGGSAPR